MQNDVIMLLFFVILLDKIIEILDIDKVYTDKITIKFFGITYEKKFKQKRKDK